MPDFNLYFSLYNNSTTDTSIVIKRQDVDDNYTSTNSNVMLKYPHLIVYQ